MSARPPSNIECLLLSQAVYELGGAPDSWVPISKILSKHPLLSRPKSFWTPALCNAWYDRLLQEAGLERTEQNDAIKAEVNLKLAKKYYQLRYQELFQLIKDEEAKFKTIFTELEDIRAGKWDSRIKAQLTGLPEAAETPETPETEELQPPVDSATPEEMVVEDQPAESPAATNQETQPTEASEEPSGEDEDEEATSDNGATEQDPDIDIDQADPTPSSTRDSVPASTSDVISQIIAEEEEDAPSDEEVDEEGEGAAEDAHEIQVDDNEEEQDSEENEAAAEEEEVATNSRHETPATRVESEDRKETEIEEGESSGDEPLQTIRRSTRRKSSASSAPPLPARGRNTRRQRQLQEPDSTTKIEQEGDEQELRPETPRTDGNTPSSPFEHARTREGKRKASLVDAPDSGGREPKRLREGSEMMEDDDHESPAPSSHNTRSRPTRQGVRSEEQVAIKRFQNVIGLLHSQISQHRNGTIFHNPIKLSEAPDYHDIVKKPMDLKTIKTRVKDGLISNSLEYQRDIYLMFANAMMYNRPSSDVYNMTEDMMIEAERQIQSFRQTEGYVRSSGR